MFIQNVSLEGIKSGRHGDAGERGVLIQITDCGGSFPVPKAKFEKVFQFDFHDSDDASEEWAPQQHHGHQLVDILKMALEERRKVIVHCHAGYSRSAAVKVMGVHLGFIDANPEDPICPNALLLKYFGITYDNPFILTFDYFS